MYIQIDLAQTVAAEVSDPGEVGETAGGRQHQGQGDDRGQTGRHTDGL